MYYCKIVKIKRDQSNVNGYYFESKAFSIYSY